MQCLFFPENAARSPYRDNSDQTNWNSFRALERLFRKTHDRDSHLPKAFPTNPQAEVQVKGKIPLSMITRLNFQDDHAVEQFESLGIKMQNQIEVRIDPSLFQDRESAQGVHRD